MKVLIAGATGALGIPLVRALKASGHEVIGITRTPGKSSRLEGLGAQPIVADVDGSRGFAQSCQRTTSRCGRACAHGSTEEWSDATPGYVPDRRAARCGNHAPAGCSARN